MSGLLAKVLRIELNPIMWNYRKRGVLYKEYPTLFNVEGVRPGAALPQGMRELLPSLTGTTPNRLETQAPLMGLLCNRCKSVNPEDALFCHADGHPLTPESLSSSGKGYTFASPLILPVGDDCVTLSNFDELASFCQANWSDGVGALQSGLLTTFLQMIKRDDLAKAAKVAAEQADPDIGLDDFLKGLPTKTAPAPQLEVTPSSQEFALKVRQDASFNLLLKNTGGRLLYGSVYTDCPWLSLGPSAVVSRKDFKAHDEMTVKVRICGQMLGASARPREALLNVTSNGGTGTATVRVQIAPQPFSGGVLKGIVSPGELVDRVRQDPVQASSWLENGSVAEWYRDNGWPFPLKGQVPQGPTAVKQFFQELGLPAVDPFANGPLAGVSKPDELIVRSRRTPAQVAHYYQDGTVPWWYAYHGWTYPQVPPVSGQSQIRRFFAALRQPDPFRAPIRLQGKVGAKISHLLTVKGRPSCPTPSAAQAKSNQNWLRIDRAEVTNAVAKIILVVSQVPNAPGKTLDAEVTLTLNDKYETIVPISLSIASG